MFVLLQRKIKAADLVERIHTEVDVYEKDYFALYFIENNQKVHICNMILTQIHELYIQMYINKTSLF